MALVDSLEFGKQPRQIILQYTQTLPISFYSGHPSYFVLFLSIWERSIYLNKNDDVHLLIELRISQLYNDILKCRSISLILHFDMFVLLCLF